MLQKLIKFGFYSALFAFASTAIMSAAIYYYLIPQLPNTKTLHNVELQVPMRVYSADGALIAEFGETKRSPVQYDEIPLAMRDAFVAIEDDAFFHHNGVDVKALLRAVVGLIRTGEKRQGGSTITMQLARNFFLSNEKSYLRKLNEILLALKIERELSKEDILTLYLNKIFLGQRAYGIAAAAQIYYGAKLNELTLAQMAMIAGLPKAPSTTNPITNAERAHQRRNLVLDRMLILGFISKQEHEHAKHTATSATLHSARIELNAAYVAEMARQEIVEQFGSDVYNKGYKIYTTINSSLQIAAQNALRQSLINYDKRHGYRGPELTLLPEQLEQNPDLPVIGNLQPAVVTVAEEKKLTARLRDDSLVDIAWPEIEWARPYINEQKRGPTLKSVTDIIKVGDVVRVSNNEDGSWSLAQVPAVQGALIAPEPNSGAIRALVGGFDFNHSKFNRATQAQRQVGSSFKPFIYSAALDKGYTLASLINDAPVVFDDAGLESAWRPKNYSSKFYGPTRLRVALRKSRNLVSVRLLRSIGINHAINHASHFGFDKNKLPRDLSLSLGSLSLTPLELARGYIVLANGGFATQPYLIERIEDSNGKLIFQAQPAIACLECEQKNTLQDIGQETDIDQLASDPVTTMNLAPRAVNQQNIYLMNQVLRDVIRRGTGSRAQSLKRANIAGKTGTTNDQRDAWFSGFNQDIVAITWVGFDDSSPLGPRETGASAALPMWIQFMQQALPLYPEKPLPRPDGMVTVRIDSETGLSVGPGHKGAIFETFRAQHVPEKQQTNQQTPLFGGAKTHPNNNGNNNPSDSGIPDQLF
ncbi:MAG: penicillin-binding protein 1A [Gammaproteobacteria bacterium]|nr:penicillin-binding protein 1A [Gammaproteobacteria bacterium]